ncbi:hypothetical protein D3C78_237390 [compost metagenome]
MLNGSPLNGFALNGIAGAMPQAQASTAPSFVWSALVTLGGEDVSARLVGTITVDREEGAAGIADFTLYYQPGDPVPVDIANRAVTIDLISTAQGQTTQTRLFTGVVAEPSWSALSRTLAVTCTDNLQQRVEALSVEQIDALVGGQWTADVFEPHDGRSRWDYALERLQSRPASLDCSPSGELRVTSWYASQTAHVVFGPGTTLYESIGVELAQLASVTNRVELEIIYRYSRFREREQSYQWSHPGTSGLTGISGFCVWRTEPTELPNVEMIVDSVSGAGQVAIAATLYRLPPTMPNPCGDGAAWINDNTDLLLGAQWTGATRWVQPATETYTLALTTEAGTDPARQVISRGGTAFEIEVRDGWEDSLRPIGVGETGDIIQGGTTGNFGPPGTRDSEPRRVAAISQQLAAAQTELIASHRQTRVTWSVPTPMALAVDLVHTLELGDQYVHARAKCSRRFDRLDLDSGACITDLTISVMRGGGEADPLFVPDRPAGSGEYGGGSAPSSPLPTQLGGWISSPPYDDELPGFSGNYSGLNDGTVEMYQRRLDVIAEEIPASERDEYTATAAQTYRVAIPNDLLEL